MRGRRFARRDEHPPSRCEPLVVQVHFLVIVDGSLEHLQVEFTRPPVRALLAVDYDIGRSYLVAIVDPESGQKLSSSTFMSLLNAMRFYRAS